MPQSSTNDGKRTALTSLADLFKTIAKSNVSRADLARLTGLSRVTLAQRVAVLIDAALVMELPDTVRSGGRPTKMLGLNPEFGVILSVDVGETHVRLAITDITARILTRSEIDYRSEAGPEPTLMLLAAELERLLDSLDRRLFVIGMGVSLPAPINFMAGRVVGPSILHGWDDFDLVSWLEARFATPVLIENDVNVMTYFEASHSTTRQDHFLFIKMGTGIGSGLIAGGELYRGTSGASGDIGHIQLSGEHAPLCRCGKVGCLEAYAAGWAIARDLRALGIEAKNARDVVALIGRQEPQAIRLVRNAGRALGEVVANCVSILNPKTIRIGGTLAATQEHLLAGVRELVYQRCLPLATRDLTIEFACPNRDACLSGAAQMVIGDILQKDPVEPMLARYEQWLNADTASPTLQN